MRYGAFYFDDENEIYVPREDIKYTKIAYEKKSFCVLVLLMISKEMNFQDKVFNFILWDYFEYYHSSPILIKILLVFGFLDIQIVADFFCRKMPSFQGFFLLMIPKEILY